MACRSRGTETYGPNAQAEDARPEVAQQRDALLHSVTERSGPRGRRLASPSSNLASTAGRPGRCAPATRGGAARRPGCATLTRPARRRGPSTLDATAASWIATVIPRSSAAGLHHVASKVALEIVVCLEQYDADALSGQEQCQHGTGWPAADDAAIGFNGIDN